VLVDACVARSFAVVGWTEHLVGLCGGCILVAQGVHSERDDEPSELRRIRDALDREAQEAGLGSGVAGRALAATQGIGQLLELFSDRLRVLPLDASEFALAVRLQSRDASDRVWRSSLGARARRLDAGEAASIAVASARSLEFATDDDDALRIWQGLTRHPASRTRDLMKRLAASGAVSEADARATYQLLQTDDLHQLGGPPW
jgi:hypothetical protein